MRRDYYAVLGITSTAGPREVRQAFRRLARQYSPYVNFWDAQAQTLFEEIAEAYRVLNDPGARALYDRFGTALAEGEALGAGQRGEDVHVSIDLDFADVARGARVHVEVPRFLPCADCRATGQADGALRGADHRLGGAAGSPDPRADASGRGGARRAARHRGRPDVPASWPGAAEARGRRHGRPLRPRARRTARGARRTHVRAGAGARAPAAARTARGARALPGRRGVADRGRPLDMIGVVAEMLSVHPQTLRDRKSTP